MKLIAKLAVFTLLVNISVCIDDESTENEIIPAEVELAKEAEENNESEQALDEIPDDTDAENQLSLTLE